MRVGDRLKNERERQNISLSDASLATHISPKYLTAIEDGRFNDLPKAIVFRVAYLREYATLLKLNPRSITRQFERENGLEGVEQKHPHKTMKSMFFSFTPFLIRNLLLGLIALLFAWYLIWQIRGIVNPPWLEVYAPLEGLVTSNIAVAVQGKTEPECRLVINGQEVRPDETGHFETGVDLAVGVNTITISAIKKHGKTTVETRHVVVRGR